MIRGLYTAATGMNVQSQKMDVISNDLANANTRGYKKDTVVMSSFGELYLSKLDGNTGENTIIGQVTPGVRIDEIFTQFQQGSLIQTSGLTDMAIQGDGFFVIQTPAGETYTRDGGFLISAEGMLVTQEGYSVMGANGPVEIGQEFLSAGGTLEFGERGEVMMDGEIIDMLQLVNFEDTRLVQKIDNNLFVSDAEPIAFTGKIISGYTEASNVNAVTAMVDMITVSRAYEANQKMVQLHDNLLGKAVNDIARV